jgi:hypothetical protein
VATAAALAQLATQYSARMSGLASIPRLLTAAELTLETARELLVRAEDEEGKVSKAACAPLGSNLKDYLQAGSTTTTITADLLSVTGDLPVHNGVKFATLTGAPPFDGLTVANLKDLIGALVADHRALEAAGAECGVPTSNLATQPTQTTAFAPILPSPWQPAPSGTLSQHANYTQLAGSTPAPPNLDTATARTLSAEYADANVESLYLLSAGIAGGRPGAGHGSGSGSAGGAAGGGPAGAYPNPNTQKVPHLHTFLLDKTDTSQAVAVDGAGKLTVKHEASTYLTQTQFTKAFMNMIVTTYSHCTKEAMAFFMHITDLWDTYPVTALMRYERAVRQKCQQKPEIPLDAFYQHVTEWMLYLGPSQHPAPARYPKQDQAARKRAASPSRSAAPARAAPANTGPRAGGSSRTPCRDFPKAGGCVRPMGTKCSFEHLCPKCDITYPLFTKAGKPIPVCPTCK